MENYAGENAQNLRNCKNDLRVLEIENENLKKQISILVKEKEHYVGLHNKSNVIISELEKQNEILEKDLHYHKTLRKLIISQENEIDNLNKIIFRGIESEFIIQQVNRVNDINQELRKEIYVLKLNQKLN